MSLFGEILSGTKGKELRERMLRSIQASRELAAELRTTNQKIDALIKALEAWTKKAEEIKTLSRR